MIEQVQRRGVIQRVGCGAEKRLVLRAFERALFAGDVVMLELAAVCVTIRPAPFLDSPARGDGGFQFPKSFFERTARPSK